MFHEHIYTYCIFYIFLVSCLLHMALHILVKYDVYESHLIHIFLFVYEFTLLRNLNQSNRIIQTKVMAFSCQTSRFTNYTRDSLYYSFFRGLNFIFGTIYLYSFKSKVLRVFLQLESPKSEHRNSRYVRNNPDYSMFKTETRIWLEHDPTLSECLGHL